MKTKLLTSIFACILLLASLANAAVTETDNIKYATVSSNGEVSYTNTPITGSFVEGYVCADASCSAVSGAIPGWTNPTGIAGSSVTLNYPTNLANPNGYIVFFYKPGYRTYEVKADWSGTGDAGTYDNYLSKMSSCHSPIDTFSVLNDVQPNVPLVIQIEGSFDATAYSAIQDTDPNAYIPPALANDYFSVETTVTLNIYDSDGDLANTQTQTVFIPYSGSYRAEFTWTPTVKGDYSASITTDVTDDKCLNSIEQSAVKEFHVLEEDPRNMCYTLLNDLAISDQFPSIGDTLTFTASKISNYADNIYRLFPVATEIGYAIVRQSDSAIVLMGSDTLSANPNAVDTASVSFDLSTASLSKGEYIAVITAKADDGRCRVNNLQETESIPFDIDESANGAPALSNLPDITMNENAAAQSNLIDLWNYASDSQSTDDQLSFTIVSQSNANLISCSISGDRYIDCAAPSADRYGHSDITVEVSDGQFSDRDSFRVNVNRVNDYPVISNIPNVYLRLGESKSLDLDNYVSDPNYARNELTWTYAEPSHFRLDFDEATHVAKFSSRTSWSGQEMITFTVTNPDGLNDTDNVMVFVSDEAAPNSISLSRIRTGDYLFPGDTLLITVAIDNLMARDLEDVEVNAVCQELGITAKSETIDVDSKGEETAKMFLEIPKTAGKGLYDIRITLSNDEVRRVLHRDFVIK
jgi:hypothetical protein